MSDRRREFLSLLGYLLFFLLLGLNITVIGLLVMNFQFGHYTENILWKYILERDEFYLQLTIRHLNQIMTELAINLLYVIYIILLVIIMYCVLRKFPKLYTKWIERYFDVEYCSFYSAYGNSVTPLVPGIGIYGESSQEQSCSNVDTQSSRSIPVASVETDCESSREHERSVYSAYRNRVAPLVPGIDMYGESSQGRSCLNVDTRSSRPIPVASVKADRESSRKHERSFSAMEMQSFLPLPIPLEETHKSSQKRLSSLPSEIAIHGAMDKHGKSKQEHPHSSSSVDKKASRSVPGDDSSREHEHRSALNSPYLIHGRSVQQIVLDVTNFRSLLGAFKVEKHIIHTMTNDLRRGLMSRNEITRNAQRRKLLATATNINGSKFIKAAINDLFTVMQETVM